MVWIKFLVSAAAISFAALKLARYADVVALRTKLGGMFVGTLILGFATSLTEILITVNAVTRGYPSLAVGNLLGANMVHMLVLAILDVLHNNRRLLRKAAARHGLTGSLTTTMISLVVFFILVNLPYEVSIGQMTLGLDSLILIAFFVFAMLLLQKQSQIQVLQPQVQEIPPDFPSLRTSILWLLGAAAVLMLATPYLVDSSVEIANLTGLGITFIGSTLVAIVTSFPELVSTISAARIGADDMAIGNLFGATMVNMAVLGLADFFYTEGRFIATVDPSFLIVGMLGLIMTLMALIGNLARLERKVLFIEADSLVILLVYFGGVALLYVQGISP